MRASPVPFFLVRTPRDLPSGAFALPAVYPKVPVDAMVGK